MSKPWEKAFLSAFAECGVVGHACAAVGIDRNLPRMRRKEDPEFAAAYDEALEAATDLLENEARRRAIEGCKDPIYQQGVLVGHRLVYSDTLMSLLLKGRRKSVFSERTEITGADGGPVKVADETTRSARVARLLEQAKLRKDIEDLL